MTINPVKKTEKQTSKEVAPQVADPAKPRVDLDKPVIQDAIAQGRMMIKEGKSKADAARLIYSLLLKEEKALVVDAFVAGAGLTDKGALTYWYNCKRKQEKLTTKS